VPLSEYDLELLPVSAVYVLGCFYTLPTYPHKSSQK
jgi:hypothetical protein